MIIVLALVAALAYPSATFGEAATAQATISLKPGVLVLKDGARIEALWISRSLTWVSIGLRDGGARRFQISEVDMEASEGVPTPSRSTSPLPSPRDSANSGRGLADSARSLKLSLPDPNEGQTWTKLESSRRDPSASTPALGAERQESATGRAEATVQPQVSAKLKPDLSALAEAWSRFGDARREVQHRCGGYTKARSSCGSRVVPNRFTARCRDALDRARSLLPAIEGQHDRLWTEARRSGIAPRQLRVMLAAEEMDSSQQRVGQARAWLDAYLD